MVDLLGEVGELQQVLQLLLLLLQLARSHGVHHGRAPSLLSQGQSSGTWGCLPCLGPAPKACITPWPLRTAWAWLAHR
jgi:hypothetical protein